MSIIVIVENDTIKLPVHVPDGTRVEVMLPQHMETLPPEEAMPEWLRSARGKATSGLSTAEIMRLTRGINDPRGSQCAARCANQ